MNLKELKLDDSPREWVKELDSQENSPSEWVALKELDLEEGLDSPRQLAAQALIKASRFEAEKLIKIYQDINNKSLTYKEIEKKSSIAKEIVDLTHKKYKDITNMPCENYVDEQCALDEIKMGAMPILHDLMLKIESVALQNAIKSIVIESYSMTCVN